MRRLLHREWVAAGFLVTGLLSGCADNESVLFIAGVMKPEAPDCEFTPQAGSTMLMRGTVDSALTESYQAALLVGNQITRQGSRDQLRTETSRVSIVGAEVHVLDEADNDLGEFTVPAQGQIVPGSGQEAGYGVVYAELLRPVSDFTGQVVIVNVQVYGETLGGEEVESNWYRFPIRVVSGMLIEFPAGVGLGGACDHVETSKKSSCFIGQDGLTPCTQCLDRPECQTLGGS